MPFRLTTSMAEHVYRQHSKELGLNSVEEAVAFVVDTMRKADHVREGDEGSFLFTVENGRVKTGRRTIAIVVNAQKGDFLGIRTSGYDRIGDIKKRPLLWEKSADKTSATDAASANVTSEPASQGGEPAGSASNQSNDLLDGASANTAEKRAESEGGQVLNLSDDTAAGLSDVLSSSDGKGSETAGNGQEGGENNSGKPLTGESDDTVQFQKGGARKPTPLQRKLGEALVHVAKEAGIEVSTDVEEMQRELEKSGNGTDAETKADIQMLDEVVKEEASPSHRHPRKTAANSEGNASMPTKVTITADKAKEIGKNLLDLQQKARDGELNAEDFLQEVRNAFTLSEKDGTSYAKQTLADGRHTLRVSSHYINANNNKSKNEQKNFDSLVIKVASGSQFKASDKVQLTEYVFYPDGLTREKQLDIVKGLQDWLASGKFTAKADKVHVSPRPSVPKKLTTASGEVYGFVKGGKMYLDPTLLNPNTPIHEYGHLWTNALMKVQPELWEHGKQMMRELPLWDEVKGDPAYADIAHDDNLVASEVFSRLLGEEGEKRLNDMVEQAKDKGVLAEAEAVTLAQRIRQWLKDVLMKVRSAFGHKWTKEEAKTVTLDELKGMALKDFAEGFNPTDIATSDSSVQKRFIGEKGAASIDKVEEGNRRMDNLKVARKMEAAMKPEDVKEVVARLFDEAARGTLTGRPITIGQMTIDGLAALKNKFGIDFKQGKVRFVVNPSDMRHIYDEHFGGNETDERNLPLTGDDIKSIVDVIYEPEHIIDLGVDPKTKAHKFAFLKDATNGCWNLVEVLADRNGVFTAKTFYKTKKKASQRINELLSSSHSTSKKRSGSLLSVANIPQMFESRMPFSENIIKLATGWERGADGKWRYEQPDFEEFDPHGGLRKTNTDAQYRRYQELVKKSNNAVLLGAETLSTEEKEELDNLTKQYAHLENSKRKGPSLSELADYIVDDALFAAYPELAELTIEEEDLGGSRSGYYEPNIFGGRIVIDSGMMERARNMNEAAIEGARSTLIHEVQHAIQHIEGFATGGNFSTGDEIRTKAKAWAWRNELAAIKQAHPDQHNDNIIERIAEQEYSQLGAELPPQDIRNKGFNLFARGYDKEGYEDAFNAVYKDRKVDYKGNASDTDTYRRLAGEVEARNVQSRMGMTDEQRKASLAADTEDVAREDQIFLRDALGGEQKSVAISDAEKADKEKQKPFHDMIDDLFNNENVDKSKYAMRYYHVADTPAFMKRIGLGGVEFTIPFKQISAHIGKDSDHLLTEKEWHELPKALQRPFLVTNYKGEKDRFRIYTQIQVGDKWVVAGVDVKRINRGKQLPMMEVNSIKTVFAKSGQMGTDEVIVCYDKNITPEQKALLGGHNSLQYPTIQELSMGKGTANSSTGQMELEESKDAVTGNGDLFRTSEELNEKPQRREGESAVDYAERMAAWAEGRSGVRESVEQTARRLHADVDYVETVADIADPALRKHFEADPRRKAAYNTRTGRMTVVGERHATANDAAGSMLHEAVGHDGLRKVVGEERFGEFLDKVYRGVTDEVRRAIDKEATGKYGGDRRTATEEHIAHLADDPAAFREFKRSGLWEKVKGWFRDMLSKARLWVGRGITDRDLLYQLWRTAKLREGGRGVFAQAEDIAKQAELKVGNYAELYHDNAAMPSTDIEEANRKFNEELQQQIDGTLPEGHVYEIGKPSGILRSAGIPDLPIEVAASRLNDKSMQAEHPFKLEEVRDLVKVIQNPLAVFRSATHIGSHVILTELNHNGRSFVVAIETYRRVGKIVVNSIRSVHYRNTKNVIGWINDNLGDYYKPTFAQEWLEPKKRELLSKPQYNSADVRKQLSSAANVIKNHHNPSIPEEKYDYRFRDDTDDTEPPKPLERVRARDEYDKEILTGKYQVREAIQDSMLGLKSLMTKIWKAAGKKGRIEDIPSYMNPYLAENAMSSRTHSEQDKYARDYKTPLVKAVAKLENRHTKHQQVLDYMMAKHGLERNVVMALRDFEAYKKKHPKGKKTLDDFRAREGKNITRAF